MSVQNFPIIGPPLHCIAVVRDCTAVGAQPKQHRTVAGLLIPGFKRSFRIFNTEKKIFGTGLEWFADWNISIDSGQECDARPRGSELSERTTCSLEIKNIPVPNNVFMGTPRRISSTLRKPMSLSPEWIPGATSTNVLALSLSFTSWYRSIFLRLYYALFEEMETKVRTYFDYVHTQALISIFDPVKTAHPLEKFTRPFSTSYRTTPQRHVREL